MLFWRNLSGKQLGTYVEYLFKLRFAMHGMDIYTPEIDDKGIDYVVRTEKGLFYEIQCKSRRQLNYFFMTKNKFPLSKTRYLALALYIDPNANDPTMYLIPSLAWKTPNSLFVDRDYLGGKSAPEWGLQFSQKNMHLLDLYHFEKIIKKL
jgi:hypothetical protein